MHQLHQRSTEDQMRYSIIHGQLLKNVPSFVSGLALLFLLFGSGGCDFGASSPTLARIDAAIDAIDKTRETIQGESTGWRDELPKLLTQLDGIESQASGDVKAIVVDTKNQVQDLTTQTINLSDAKAQDLVAQAGVEFRCNTDFAGAFVRQGVIDQLQAIEDDLKFWQQNNKHLDKKPNHAVCWINPSALKLNKTTTGWSIDPSNMSDQNIVRVFGYNFRSDALPSLELRDAKGQKIRNVKLTAAYVTRYLINLDLSTENFPEVAPGFTAIFNWPDIADPTDRNTINLITSTPAKLTISNPVWSPASPTATQDSVTLQVMISNSGGSRSESFVVTWQPDPNDGKVFPVNQLPLEAGQSRSVSFPGYVYKRSGVIVSVVSLSTGADVKSYPLTVLAKTYVYTLDYSTTYVAPGGGGHGGNPYDIRCLTGSVATGVVGRAHDVIDQIHLNCSLLNQNGTTGQPAATNSAGGNGGDPYGIYCAANQALTEFKGRSGALVDQFDAYCTSISGGAPLDVGHAGASGAAGSDPYDSKCADSYVVTGISGRAGDKVDQINTICTKIIAH